MDNLDGTLVGLLSVSEPKEGRYAVKVPGITFVAGTEKFNFSSQSLKSNKLLTSIQTIWVNANKCTQGKNIYLTSDLQTLVIPGGKQGFYAVTGNLPYTFSITADAGLSGELELNLYNFAVVPGESQTIQTISGTVTTNQGDAGLTPWNENIEQIGGAAITLGQKTGANSLPVVLSSDEIVPVKTQGGTIAGFGQAGVTNAAQQLPVGAARKVRVKAPSANAASVFVGGAGVTVASGFEVGKGESFEFEVSDSSEIYYIGTNADKLYWIRMN